MLQQLNHCTSGFVKKKRGKFDFNIRRLGTFPSRTPLRRRRKTSPFYNIHCDHRFLSVIGSFWKNTLRTTNDSCEDIQVCYEAPEEIVNEEVCKKSSAENVLIFGHLVLAFSLLRLALPLT
jgi:hypothetical protein